VITVPERHTQTDGRTDGQTTYDSNTVLCTKVHRAVKIGVRQSNCSNKKDALFMERSVHMLLATVKSNKLMLPLLLF